VDATDVLPIVSVLALITVEFGGLALLGYLAEGRAPVPGGDAPEVGRKMRFFRAGHAHAGVLIVLSLVYFIYLDRARFSNGVDWLIGLVLVVGTLAQCGGFFVHMGAGAPERATAGTTLTRLGALLIAIALIVLAIGLIKEL
jgi:hypothetical protein